MQSIVVLAGGMSGEREVSLRSGKAVAAALTTAGFAVTFLELGADPREHMEVMEQAAAVFPVLHGAGGEDGTLQALLEAEHIRYVGSDAAASALCFDKWQYRQKVVAGGLPMAEAALITQSALPGSPLLQAAYVLKPYDGGSSLDTYIVRDPIRAPFDQIATSFEHHPKMLLEQLIIGTELTVGILGETPLPVIEIIPPPDGEFDYENKYNGQSQELCPPEHVSKETQRAAQSLALKAHKLTGCRDFSRTDIMCDAEGNLLLLETNTIPGMTEQSLFPKMARTANVDMPELCKRLVEMALSR